jgi:hypothetical protein
MSTYRYNWIGVDTSELQASLRATLAVTIEPTSPKVTIEVLLTGETLADKSDLDAAMLSQGWDFDGIVT